MSAGSSVAYNEQTEEEYGEQCIRTWELDKKKTHLHMSGPCPRCKDASAFDWPLRIVMTALPATAADEGERVPVRCECKVVHRGSNGKPGCGAHWSVVVT